MRRAAQRCRRIFCHQALRPGGDSALVPQSAADGAAALAAVLIAAGGTDPAADQGGGGLVLRGPLRGPQAQQEEEEAEDRRDDGGPEAQQQGHKAEGRRHQSRPEGGLHQLGKVRHAPGLLRGKPGRAPNQHQQGRQQDAGAQRKQPDLFHSVND